MTEEFVIGATKRTTSHLLASTSYGARLRGKILVLRPTPSNLRATLIYKLAKNGPGNGMIVKDSFPMNAWFTLSESQKT